jgi:hypothetical protein
MTRDRRKEETKERTGLGNIFPILFRLENEVGFTNGSNLLYLVVPIEWCVTTQQEVGDDSDCPHLFDVDELIIAIN